MCTLHLLLDGAKPPLRRAVPAKVTPGLRLRCHVFSAMQRRSLVKHAFLFVYFGAVCAHTNTHIQTCVSLCLCVCLSVCIGLFADKLRLGISLVICSSFSLTFVDLQNGCFNAISCSLFIVNFWAYAATHSPRTHRHTFTRRLSGASNKPCKSSLILLLLEKVGNSAHNNNHV